MHCRLMVSNRQQFVHKLDISLKTAQVQAHRVMLVLAGEAYQYLDIACDRCRAAHARTASGPHTSMQSSSDLLYVPDMHSTSDASDQINSLLGSEHRCIVFDARNKFDERLFAACTGTIKAGGLLILQTPPVNEWPGFQRKNSPVKQSFFLSRFYEKLTEHQSLAFDTTSSARFQFSCVDDVPKNVAVFIANTTQISNVKDSGDAAIALGETWQIEQNTLLEALLNNLQKKQDSVSVVQGDRGRGKSTLIGRTIRCYLTRNPHMHQRITMTANRRSACDILLLHAQHQIPFLPIENALTTTHDILIVEEAGSIPIPVLEQLMHQSQSIIYATTVQGYEGSGRGFAIRFSKTLDKLKPGWLKLNPTLPVRWATGDPLEAFVNDALLLETTIPDITGVDEISPARARVSLIDKNTLVRDHHLLAEVYGLLVQAHYQTTPADLRNLLDQQRLLVFAQRTGTVLTGAALVALEGEIPSEYHKAIKNKKRRLPDQLIPQLLAQSAGDTAILHERFARIVRIAVHPSIQQQGFGTHLFEHIVKGLRSKKWQNIEHITAIGASFGADQHTLSFWLKLGLKPVHYGYKSNPRSGLRAVCMIESTHAVISSSVEKASHILHLNLLAQVPQRKTADPVSLQLINATRSAHEYALSSGDAGRLVQDYYQARRSFIDSVGLILADRTFSKNRAMVEMVHRIRDGYLKMSPKTRRAEESLLRAALLESGVVTESN